MKLKFVPLTPLATCYCMASFLCQSDIFNQKFKFWLKTIDYCPAF